jgi:mycofactocin precursor
MFARPKGPARTRGYTPGMPDATLHAADEQAEHTDEVLVEDELLVEEISIDGMCGVY